jgi:hypothetical protein
MSVAKENGRFKITEISANDLVRYPFCHDRRVRSGLKYWREEKKSETTFFNEYHSNEINASSTIRTLYLSCSSRAKLL